MNLIDADSICYAAGFVTQATIYHIECPQKPGQIWIAKTKTEKENILARLREEDLDLEFHIEKELHLEPVSHALQIAKTIVYGVQEALKGPSKLFLTGKGNFRNTLATIKPYKGNRNEFDKPAHLQAVRDYLVDKWGASLSEGCEADDSIAIESTRLRDECVIVSIDKDLDQLPGMHYNWRRKEIYEVDEREGWRNFYKQMLVGDTTDNIPGLPGIGPAKADKLLKDYSKPGAMWGGVYRAYHSHYGHHYGDTELTLGEALLEIGNLLYLWRKPDDSWSFPV